MTTVVLKESQFIIRLGNNLLSLLDGSEMPKVELINPHKEGEYDIANSECYRRTLKD